MNQYLSDFLHFLAFEESKSKNTIEAYKRDILSFQTFLSENGDENLLNAGNGDVVSYLLSLKDEGKSAATSNRRIAALRAFYDFLIDSKILSKNPTDNVKSPKVKRTTLEYLTIAEVEKLLSIPDATHKGLRDKAILELLYATGIRVTELISADLSDVNLKMGFFTCTGEYGKARIIPMGIPAREAMENYLENSREFFLRSVKEKENSEPTVDDPYNKTALFLNYYGERITRQGLWKIINEYAITAGVDSKITPQTLRNSFAVHMIQNGADIKSLQELMGHDDITAMQIYLNVTKNRIKDVYDRTHPRAR